MSYRIPKRDADDGGGGPRPGRYFVEVAAAEAKRSKAGDPMLKIRVKNVENGKTVLYDHIMLGGRGAGIGAKKARAFGMVTEDGDDLVVASAPEWIGSRAYVTAKRQEGGRYLEADFDATEWFGYEPEDLPAPDASKPSKTSLRADGAPAAQGKLKPDVDDGFDSDDIPF